MFKIIIILLLGCAINLFSQTVVVIDKTTDEPIGLVNVISQNPLKTAITNSKGEVDITRFLNSEYIEFKMIGFKSEKLSLQQLKDNGFKVFLSTDLLNMEEILVSANKWSQSSNEIPMKITQISAKDVQLQNPQTAADLLSISGEVFIQKSQQGGGSPMIRGFATNRLLYALDGVRMNTAIFRGGNIQNVISLDPFSIENTEVLFGPGSVIYGSDAIGGVMSFSTLTPLFSLSDKPITTGKTSLRYSSANNENTGHFDVNIGWKNFSMITSLSYNNFDDLMMGSNGPNEFLKDYYVIRQNGTDISVQNENSKIQKPSAYSQMNLMQKFRLMPGIGWDIQYGFHYSETSEYGRYDRNLRTRNGLPRYAEWNYGPQKWMMNNLNISNSNSTSAYDFITFRLALQNFEESRIDRSYNSSERSIRIEKVDAYSANLDAVKSIGKNNKLFYGLEYVLNDVNSEGIDEDISAGIKVPGSSRYPDSKWQSFALYLNNDYEISEKIVLQTGIRYNHILLDANFDTTYFSLPFTNAELNSGALTGSLGFVYRPEEDLVLSTNLSTAFRSPNVDDLGKIFDSEPGSVVVPNDKLSSEYAYNIDFGFAKKFGSFLKIDMTAYYTFLDNALVRRNFTLNGQDSIYYDGLLSQVQAIQNAAKATVYGIQAGFEIKHSSGIELSTDFNYQKGEEELDDGTISPSRHAAPWFGITRISYSDKNLVMMLYATYSGEKAYEDLPEEEKGKTEIYGVNSEGNPYSPGWYTLNFKSSYKMGNGLIIESGLENLTDQRYRPYSSGISPAGRNFVIGITLKF